MDIKRVIKAIQRTSHFSNKQMQKRFPELYVLRVEEQLSEIRWLVTLDARSRVAEIRGTACPVKRFAKSRSSP